MKVMKKIIVLMLSIILSISYISNISYAEDTEVVNLKEKLDSIWLKNYEDDVVLEQMKITYEEYMDNKWIVLSHAPNYARAQIGYTGTMEEQEKQLREDITINYNDGFKFYYFAFRDYLSQYVQNSSMEYLLSKESYWVVPYANLDSISRKFKNDGTYLEFGMDNLKDRNIYDGNLGKKML